MIAAIALAASLITWAPGESAQIGVMMGAGVDQHLILLVPETGCHDGMKIYGGRFGDFDKSLKLLKTSNICALVDQRSAKFRILLQQAKAKKEAR